MKNIFVCVKKGRLIALIVCLVLIFSHVILYLSVNSYKDVIDSVNRKIFNSFNKDEINSDDNNIFFVVNSKDKNLGNKQPQLYLPSSESYQLNGGVFSYSLKENFVIKCSGYGVVKNVGFLDNGLKYVEIKHSGNIVTRYENLKIVGVGANFLVKNIHVIGTSDENFVFKILKNNKIVENFIVENGEIKWQN